MRVFLARDPGGANVIVPLFRNCPGPKVLWAKDYARAVAARADIPFRDVNAEMGGEPVGPDGQARVDTWLRGIPDATLLVTGTSNIDDFTERLGWRSARRSGIPSVAMIDQWVRPLERFQWHGKTHRPDYIVALSQAIADRLQAGGCARKGCVVLGHPHLREVLDSVPDLSVGRDDTRRWLMERFGKSFDLLVTYASEPFRYLAGKQALFADVPYDEIQVLRMVQAALEKSGLRNALLLAKLHPKEEAAAFAPWHAFFVKDELSNFDVIAASDLVVGLKGMFLIESVLFGKAVYSLALHPSPDEQLVTNGLGLSKQAGDADELAGLLRGFPDFQAPAPVEIAGKLGLSGDLFQRFGELLDRAEAEGRAR